MQTDRFHGGCLFFAVMTLAMLSLLPETGAAASIAAFSQNEGYSGSVMDKVLSKWSPPAQIKGDYQLKLRIGLDDKGQVLECKPIKNSGLQALDVSACSAVKAAAPFGPPPYGMPVDVYFSFWTGMPKVKVQENAAPETQTSADKANEDARNAHERARALAAEAARGQQAKRNDAGHSQASATAPATAAEGSDQNQKYLSRVKKVLRDAMYVPVQTKPGTYLVETRVKVDRTGKILGAEIIKGSSDELLNKYVLQGIHRAGKIAPPPPGLGEDLDFTFRMVRQ